MEEELFIIRDKLDYDNDRVTIYNSYEIAVNNIFRLEKDDKFGGNYTLQVYKYNKESSTYDYETELSLKDLIEIDNLFR